MNNKAFTLVEVLAMLIVLGIIVGIAVPNITGILSNQKLNVVVDDAKKMIADAKTTIATDNDIDYPKQGECTMFTLSRIDKGENVKNGPNGEEYDRYRSFVTVTKQGKKYVYTIRLVEKAPADTYYGFDLIDNETLESEGTRYVKKINNALPDFSEIQDEDVVSAKTILPAGACPSSTLTEFYN